MAKTLTIILNRGPVSSEFSDMALKTAIKARDKGYNVNMWLHIDGVWLTQLKKEKQGESTGNRLKEARAKGIQIKICGRCTDLRDLGKAGETIDGMQIMGLPELIGWLRNSDKVLTFAG